MTPILVRNAEIEDATAIHEHMMRVLEEAGEFIPFTPDEYEEHRLSEILDSDNSIFLLAEEAGELLGILECKGGKAKAMRHVTGLSMSVRKESRNQGIGSELLAEAIAWARDTGIVKRIELYVYARNKPAIHLYEKFDFEIEGCCRRAIFQNNEYFDDLIMALLL